jgi:hypothetical protein
LWQERAAMHELAANTILKNFKETMQGELIESILIPKREDWIVLQTNKGLYYLRLGGVSKAEQIERLEYHTANFPLIGKTIAKVYTDDFLILIETADGDGLKHSPDASIDSDGETSFGISYLSKDQFQEVKQDNGDLLVEI